MAASWSVVALLLASALALTSGQACVHQSEVVEANGRFAIALYNEIRTGPSVNMIFSPFSVSTALAMTHHGATDQTKLEMELVLRFYGMGPTCLAEHGFQSLLTLLNETSTINTANRIYVDYSVDVPVRFL